MPSVESQDDLGIGVRLEHVACDLAVLAQCLEVVDLAVEDDGVAGEVVEHRLMAGGAEVDDAQTRMAKDADAAWRRPKATIIRAAMGDAGDHSVDRSAFARAVQFSSPAMPHMAASDRAEVNGTPSDADS